MLESGRFPDVVNGWDTERLTTAYPKLAPVQWHDQRLPGSGSNVPARIYRSVSGPSTDTLVWAHGGALVLGDLDMPESHWVGLTLAANGFDVVTLDYRKALHATTFPAPSDDVLDGWRWVDAQQSTLGLGSRLHLGGASAGGNLTAGVTKRLLDGEGPLPYSLLLVYPLVSPILDESDLPNDQESSVARELVALGAQHFAGAAGTEDPIAFAANGPINAGHPKTLFVLAEDDMLRGQAMRYADRLADQGVGVRAEVLPGSAHAFLNEPGTDSGEQGLQVLVTWLADPRP